METFSTDTSTQYAAWGGIVALGIYFIRMVLRRISRDVVEGTHDRAEINIVKTLQEQISILVNENTRLRSIENDLLSRVQHIESKNYEYGGQIAQIERLQRMIEKKEQKVESLIRSHSEDTSNLKLQLNLKDNEIKELSYRIKELERIIQERPTRCPHCNKSFLKED